MTKRVRSPSNKLQTLLIASYLSSKCPSPPSASNSIPQTHRGIPLTALLKDQLFFTPNFLLWLDRFAGTWHRDGARLEIDRRNDGGLAARSLDGKRKPLIDLLNSGWTKLEPPPGPLGFRPVILSKGLIGLWLEPENAKSYEYAALVSSGTRILLEKLETTINQTPPELRELKWLSWWKHHAENQPETISLEDIAVHKNLFECFQRDLG